MRLYKMWSKFGKGLMIPLLFIIIFTQLQCGSNWYFSVREYFSNIENSYENHNVLLMKYKGFFQDLGARETNTGCNTPIQDPFLPEIAKFDQNVPAIVCDGDIDWVECRFSECYVKQPILDRMQDLQCTYRDIVYIDDENHFIGKAVKVHSDGKYMLNKSDFVRVTCSGLESNSSNWQRSIWQGRKAGYRPLKRFPADTTSLNVFVLILDSVSRNTFIRRMPISYKVLKDELLAVVMNAYNIVGSATPGALWPILTGHHDFELPDYRRRPKNTKRIDPKPFLFTLLNEYGYRTAYYEDMTCVGTFTFRYNGFNVMPVDHYMRHLLEDIGWCNCKNCGHSGDHHCFGSESLFKYMVEYSAQLFKMSDKKFCVTFSGTFSHDNINEVTMVDEHLAQFLKKFKRDGHLNDTVLFVMADHGYRSYPMISTYEGRIDQNLPFVSLTLPKRLQKARPEALHNLVVNSKVLTTPFDIHTTILDSLGLKKHRNKYKVPGSNHERGMSFLEPIPESRSCAEAGIVPHYCTCSRWHNVSVNDVVFTKVARELAGFVNKVTAQNRYKCAKRNLLSIAWVHRLGPNEYNPNLNDNMLVHDKANRVYYQAKILMDPGEAIFEGSVQYMVKEDYFVVSDGDVSRVDRYGDEPSCISHTHPHLRKYCYCTIKEAVVRT